MHNYTIISIKYKKGLDKEQLLRLWVEKSCIIPQNY